MTDKQFKIRVTDKKTGKVVSYFKLEDNNRFFYDLFTGYQDMNGKDLYTNDEIEFYFNGEDTKETGVVSKNISEIDFMAINKNETGFPLVHMKQMRKISEEKE